MGEVPGRAAHPGRPAWSNRRRWIAAFRSARPHLRRNRVGVAAGAFAYRWFLSLFPVVIALLGVASLVEIPQHVTVSLIHGVSKALPPGAADVLSGAIAQASKHSGGAVLTTIVAAVVALWSGTSGMVMVEEGLDMAYEAPVDRSFLRKRLLALPLLLGSALLGGAASALVVFGSQLGSAIVNAAPVGGSAFLAGWTAVRWAAALIFIFLLFSLLYYLAPNRPRPRRQDVVPGALVGTAMWALISLGFSYYTSSFGSYARTYGALAGVAILIFWLYLTGIAIFVGGEVNAAFEREALRGAPGPAPGEPPGDAAGEPTGPAPGEPPGDGPGAAPGTRPATPSTSPAP